MKKTFKEKFRTLTGVISISDNFVKMIATVAVCALGAISMYVTKGQTGIGWAIFAIFIIW